MNLDKNFAGFWRAQGRGSQGDIRNFANLSARTSLVIDPVLESGLLALGK
jgi:hypothetical protein